MNLEAFKAYLCSYYDLDEENLFEDILLPTPVCVLRPQPPHVPTRKIEFERE